jgi:hypothetical protein
MAKTFITDPIRTITNPSIAHGDEVIFAITQDIAKVVIELVFPSTGTGNVYTSIDSYDDINAAIIAEDDSALTWTAWSLGAITQAAATKRASIDGVNAIRFVNSGVANNVVFNYRGLFGRKSFNDLVASTYYDDLGVKNTGAFYLGDSGTNGSWRFIQSGNDLVIQRRETGSWVTKDTILA